MSLSPLFSLHDELLIEIFSNLSPYDIYTCRRTCRQLNELIVNSQLLQYVSRTALSGVFDSLHDPGLSLPDRLVALDRWEIAWMELDLREPSASIDAPVPTRRGPPVQFKGGGRYFVVIREGYGISAGYSFLDMYARSSQHTNASQWTTIEVNTPNVLVFAFASQLNLAVAISAPTHIDRRRITLTISPMWFSTGKPHPLASEPKLEMTVTGAAAHNLSDTEVIGDYILYWVGAPMYSRSHEGSLCSIYLIAWKEGWVSELRSSRPGMYGSVISVLSEDIMLLIRLREPALELCRLINIGDREKASLETVRILSLPELTISASLRWATCFGEHPGHELFSKYRYQRPPPLAPPLLTTNSGSGSSTGGQPEGRICHRRRLRSVPSDGIISVVMQVNGLSGYFCTIDLTVRCRTLLEFADTNTLVGDRAAEASDTKSTLEWKNWGPDNTRILEHDSLTWGSLVGERRATVGQVSPLQITMRDYNSFRVRRAREMVASRGAEPGTVVKLECGSVVKVIEEMSSYRGGEWFCDDIETRLPYVETVTPYPRCEGIFMDEENLLAEVRTEAGQRKFYLHSL